MGVRALSALSWSEQRMEKLHRVKRAAWLAACIVLVRSTGHGVDATDLLVYSVGPLRLKPHLGLTQKFDDNIYYRDQNIESDLVTIISPGLSLQLGKDAGDFIRLDYGYDQLLFLEHPKEDSAEQHFNLNGKYKKSKIHVTTSDRVGVI